jgi:hypothetical protein
MKFPFCGVIRAGADAQADAEQDLLEAGAEEIQVDGMKAYRMEAGKLRAMTGAQLPPGSENFSFLVAQVDDGSFLLASDEAALRAIHGASGSSAGEAIPGLAEAVGTRAEHAICLAAYVDGGLKTLMPPEEVAGTPPFVQNMKGLGIGLDMGTGLDLQAELLTGSSQDAAVVLQMIQQQLAQARQQLAAGAEANPGMAPVAQQVGPFLEKIAVTAEGSNVQLAFSLTDAEIGQLMMMGMMMMGGMGGGAQAAPPGGGMPPGMGGF